MKKMLGIMFLLALTFVYTRPVFDRTDRPVFVRPVIVQPERPERPERPVFDTTRPVYDWSIRPVFDRTGRI